METTLTWVPGFEEPGYPCWRAQGKQGEYIILDEDDGAFYAHMPGMPDNCDCSYDSLAAAKQDCENHNM